MERAAILEILRQVLRLLGLGLVTIGFPASVAALLEHPDAAAVTLGLISYSLAELGWIGAKWREWALGLRKAVEASE